jgi:dCTP deaminase
MKTHRGSNPTDIHEESGLLSDIQILDRLIADDDTGIFISPLVDPAVQLGPSSLDLHLGPELGVAEISNSSHVDLTAKASGIAADIKKHFVKYRVGPGEDFVIHPGEFTLGATLEYLRLPLDIAGRLEGRSTLGRLGLQVHSTAGFVDPGFEGILTFEFINVGKLPLRISPGLRVGQICFFSVNGVQVGYLEKKLSSYGRRLGVEFAQVGPAR